MQGKGELEREDYLLQRLEQSLDKPEIPEPLMQYRRVKRYNLMTHSGGLGNQPHIELLEFDVVDSAIQEFQHIQAINAKARNRGR